MEGAEVPQGAAPVNVQHRQHKPRGKVSDQQRRRDIALERQRAARRDLQQHARHLALSSLGEGGNSHGQHHHTESREHGEQEATAVGGDEFLDREGQMVLDQPETSSSTLNPREERRKQSKESGQRGLLEDGAGIWSQQSTDWYAGQLALPEWLLDIPDQLSSDWLVLPRPEGRRCLVTSSHGETVSRLRNGRILHRFASPLPGGARGGGGASGAASAPCILDCIFHEPDQTFYLLDVMCWKGYSLYDCPADFRLLWLQSKLAEREAEVGAVAEGSFRFGFRQVPFHTCTGEGLVAAHSGEELPFVRDGLLLYNRHAHYTLGLTPLVLLWKDPLCSRYFIDTDAEGNIPPLQQVILELRADWTLATSDDPPVVVGSVDAAMVQESKGEVRPGALLRFAIGESGLQFTAGQISGAHLVFQGPANQRKGGGDSISKIVFQYMARRDPLTIEALMAAAAIPPEEPNAAPAGPELMMGQ